MAVLDGMELNYTIFAIKGLFLKVREHYFVIWCSYFPEKLLKNTEEGSIQKSLKSVCYNHMLQHNDYVGRRY